MGLQIGLMRKKINDINFFIAPPLLRLGLVRSDPLDPHNTFVGLDQAFRGRPVTTPLAARRPRRYAALAQPVSLCVVPDDAVLVAVGIKHQRWRESSLCSRRRAGGGTPVVNSGVSNGVNEADNGSIGTTAIVAGGNQVATDGNGAEPGDNVSGQAGIGFDLNNFSTIKRRTWYCDNEKRAIYVMILQQNSFGPLKHGVSHAISQLTGVSQRCVSRIWKNGQDGGGINAVNNKKMKNCGRKKILLDTDVMREVSLDQRTTLQDLATSLNMKKTTVHKRLKEGKFWRHSNDLKPILTDDNKKSRVR